MSDDKTWRADVAGNVERHGCFLFVLTVLLFLTCARVETIEKRVGKLEATSGKETKDK